jgi:hypothetical protein
MGSIDHRRLLTLILVAALSIAFQARPALAVHTNGVFELGGNSQVDNAGQDDFDTISAGPGGSFTHIFSVDHSDPATDDFTVHAGGDKEEHFIKDWGCTTKNNVLDKLDLRYGYAAAYNIGGELYVFFGANRDKGGNNGDAGFGFWFFQDVVKAKNCNPGPGTFTGHKRAGDMFVAGNFTGGGHDLVVNLYRWDDPTPLLPESGDEALTLVTPTPIPACNENHDAVDPDLCIVVNLPVVDGGPGDITSAWDGELPERTYLEGGINLTSMMTRFLGKDVCYKTFRMATRSSQEVGADLEDFPFTLGAFPSCGSITVQKQTNPAGSSQAFNFVTSGGPDGIGDAFALSDGDSHETPDVRPGTYKITENVPAGWLVSVVCEGGPFGAGAAYTNGNAFVLAAGDSVSCAFTNTLASSGGDPGGGSGASSGASDVKLSKGIVHEIGLGARRAGIALSGTFFIQGNLNMAAGAQLTITSLLREDGGRELVTGLPLSLPITRYNKNGTVGTFKTGKGVDPIGIVKIGTPGAHYNFQMQIAKVTIAVPSGCPSPTLTMSFTINDGVNPPVVVTLPVLWTCHGEGQKYLSRQ